MGGESSVVFLESSGGPEDAFFGEGGSGEPLRRIFVPFGDQIGKGSTQGDVVFFLEPCVDAVPGFGSAEELGRWSGSHGRKPSVLLKIPLGSGSDFFQGRANPSLGSDSDFNRDLADGGTPREATAAGSEPFVQVGPSHPRGLQIRGYQSPSIHLCRDAAIVVSREGFESFPHLSQRHRSVVRGWLSVFVVHEEPEQRRAWFQASKAEPESIVDIQPGFGSAEEL
jgi:hypothetical protein